MKIRNGFVSNSSSSSFILAFPKSDEIKLKNIEDWLGGYSNVLPEEEMEMIGFLFWKTQFFTDEGYRRTFEEDEGTYDHHYCDAPYEYLIANRSYYCGWNMSEEDIPAECLACKYHKIEKRTNRGDDYYTVKDCLISDEATKWLEEHKDMKIIDFTVDDNEPGSIPYEIANDITSNAEDLFVNPKNVYCTGGK